MHILVTRQPPETLFGSFMITFLENSKLSMENKEKQLFLSVSFIGTL